MTRAKNNEVVDAGAGVEAATATMDESVTEPTSGDTESADVEKGEPIEAPPIPTTAAIPTQNTMLNRWELAETAGLLLAGQIEHKGLSGLTHTDVTAAVNLAHHLLNDVRRHVHAHREEYGL